MAQTLQQLDYSILQQCIHCGLCLPACPTYDATKRERHSPRGRIALMRAVADGELEMTRSVAEEMSYCLGCLACQTACPAGVNYTELFETARAETERKHLMDGRSRWFWRTLSLKFIFMRPRMLRLAGRVLRLYQNSGMQTMMRKLRLTRLLPVNIRRLESQTPTMAPLFSFQLIAPKEEPAGIPRYRVALLTGCVQDLIFPSVNRDTADVLLANGCSVYTPKEQPCCGSLHAHNGEPELATRLARRMIDLLPPQDFDAIITNAGGCGSHLRHYSNLLHNDPKYTEAACQWDKKVRDIHEWLVEIDCRQPLAPPFNQPTTVTYHESCHLVHGQKVSLPPRQILRLLPKVRLVELNESTWCCGSAGVYSLTQPDQSAALLKRKIKHIRDTGAVVLATSNPGCHLQIAQGLRAVGAAVEILQPVTLLARAYRRENPPDKI